MLCFIMSKGVTEAFAHTILSCQEFPFQYKTLYTKCDTYCVFVLVEKSLLCCFAIEVSFFVEVFLHLNCGSENVVSCLYCKASAIIFSATSIKLTH